ncbi:MAG: hypothetical protein ACK5PP_04605 [Acidimicrobiales bacterium]
MADTYYLVVANQTLGGSHLVSTIADRSREGARIHVTVPATPVDDYDAPLLAQHRLDQQLEQLKAAGVTATGNVGPRDPLEAIREQLDGERHFSGLIVSTLPRGLSKWLHLDLPNRAAREFGLTVEWVEAADDDDEPETVHITLPPKAKGVTPNVGEQNPPMRT